MMIKKASLSGVLLCGLMRSVPVFANEAGDVAQNPFGFDVSFDANRKHYKLANINSQTLSATPSYHVGRFTFALDVPYIRQTGERTIYQPATTKNDKKIKIPPGTVHQGGSATGIGDVSATVLGKLWSSADNASQLNASYIHKFDNGDDKFGIGTGTTDDTVEASFDHYWEQLGVSLGAGHTRSLDQDTHNLQPSDDFSYGFINPSYALNEYWLIGVLFNYSQAQFQDQDDKKELTWYATLFPMPALSIKGYYLRDGSKGQPQHQIGVTVSYSIF